MVTKEKNGRFIGFIMTLIICLCVFVYPAHAADLQETDADAAAVQTELTEPEADLAEAESAQEEQQAALVPAPAETEAAEAEPVDTAVEDLPDTEPAAESADSSDAALTEAPDTAETDAVIIETETEAASEEPVSEETFETEVVLAKSAAETITASAAAIEAVKETADTPVPVVRPLKDGTYIIVSKLNGFKSLQPEDYKTDNGRQIEVRDCDGTDAQKFKFVSDAATGYYTITNVLSGKNLAVKGDNLKEGTSIVQNASSSTLGQKWILVEKDGYYMLQSALEGGSFVLSLKNGSTGNGADAILQEAKDAASQLFSFLVSKPSVTISEGVYEISSALNSSMRWDIASGNMNNNGNLQLYKSNGSDAQKFIVSKVGNNKYVFTSYHSGKVVDLTSSSKAAGTNVQQYSRTDADAQKWIIRNTGDGTLYISSVVSGMPIDVAGGKILHFIGERLRHTARKNNNSVGIFIHFVL